MAGSVFMSEYVEEHEKGEGKGRGDFAVPMAQFGRGLAEAPPQASPDSDAPTRSDPRNALGAGRPPPKAMFCSARLFGY